MDESIKLNKTLTGIFNIPKWTVKEKAVYEIIKKFNDRYTEKYLIESATDDIKIIRSNLKDLNWYTTCKNQCSITSMLSTLKIENAFYTKDQTITLLSILIRISSWHLHISYYYNRINECVNYFIYFVISHKKYYISYYTKVIGQSLVSDTDQQLLLESIPEIDKIHIVTKSDLTKNELLMFFIEVILYYDQSGEIGNLPLSQYTKITLNKIHNTGEKKMKEKKK